GRIGARRRQRCRSKVGGALLRCIAPLTSTWTLTLTAVVELDVAVDVDSIVDLHLDHRSRWFGEDPEATRGSTYKVEEGLNVYVAVQVNVLRPRRGQRQRLRKNVP